MFKLNLRRRIHLYEVFNIAVWTLVCVFIIAGSLVAKQPILPKEQSTMVREVFVGLLTAIVVVFLFFATYEVLLLVALSKRNKNIARIAYEKRLIGASAIPLSASLLRLADRKYDAEEKNVYLSDTWGFCDFQFSVVRKNKYRTFKAKTYHFSVAVFMLPRKLPNIFFDSKKSGGREFGMRFRKTQRHSLEGDFDTYFQTYFHEDYTIDNLSFITPDLMQVLKTAMHYDIEIFEDKLYLYSELEDMPAQLLDMERLGTAIRAKLMRNIEHYRDERIDSQIGRNTVSVHGIRLRQAVGVHYARAALYAVVLVIALLIIFETKLSSIAFYAVIIAVGGLIREFMTLRDIFVDEKLRHKFKNIGA